MLENNARRIFFIKNDTFPGLKYQMVFKLFASTRLIYFENAYVFHKSTWLVHSLARVLARACFRGSADKETNCMSSRLVIKIANSPKIIGPSLEIDILQSWMIWAIYIDMEVKIELENALSSI